MEKFLTEGRRRLIDLFFLKNLENSPRIGCPAGNGKRVPAEDHTHIQEDPDSKTSALHRPIFTMVSTNLEF